MTINFPAVQKITHLSPIKALFWSAAINGVVAVPIMVAMMPMSSNRKVMGRFVEGSKMLRVLGWLAAGAMALATVGVCHLE